MDALRLLVLPCCLLLWAGPAAADTARLDRLRADLDRMRREAGVAGAGLVLASAGEVVAVEGFGELGWDDPRPVGAGTVFRIGSISKAFTALAFLKLAEQGRLALDAPLSRLIQPVPYDNPWAATHPVTIAQLLEHSAGLGDLVDKEWDHNVALPLAEALALAPESRRLRWPPGLHSSYSNSGAGVAAYAMERATGLDFEAYVAAEVFAPLGMASARFVPTPALDENMARGYDRDGRRPIPYWHTLYRPFGGINVELAEMGRFLMLLLNHGEIDGRRVLEPASIARMETPATTLAARRGLTFGYGLGNYHYVHRGFVFHGHGGDADGYLSHYGYHRGRGLGYFVVINAFQGRTLKRMRERVEDFIVAGAAPAFTPGVPQPAAHLHALTGAYRAATRRFGGRDPVRVVFEHGRLVLKRGARAEILIPQSQWLFRRHDEPVATTAFIPHEGALYLQGPFGNYVRDGAAGSDQ